MSVNEIIILVAIGLSAGILSGLLGIGGAILMVPALIFFFGMTQHQAQGTSLAILLFPVVHIQWILEQPRALFRLRLAEFHICIRSNYFLSLFRYHWRGCTNS